MGLLYLFTISAELGRPTLKPLQFDKISLVNNPVLVLLTSKTACSISIRDGTD
jgi:hypothetical protein